MKPLLTYRNKKFFLTGIGLNRELGLRAAARHRDIADSFAEKVLNRAFVKRYSQPAEILPDFLDSHQIEGVRWILGRSRSYLAHAPGAGKTCQAIVASLYTPGPGQVLFIVPPSLTANWEREIGKWVYRTDPRKNRWASVSVVPETRFKHYTGWSSDFIICPDSMIGRPWAYARLTAMKKRFVAVDEASRFKDPKAKRTRALFGSDTQPGLVHYSRHAVLMDGSPMPNRPMELWAPTYAMSPESIDFMDEQEFGFRYCGATMNGYGKWEFRHSSREDELKERLQLDFMHVVTEEQLDHPERLRTMLFMTKDARTPQMKEWERRHLTGLNFNELKEEDSQGALAKHRALLGRHKIEWSTKYIQTRLEKKESVLVFAWHRDVCEGLANALEEYLPGLVIGGISEETREHYFRSFQSGKTKLIIGNIAAMGRGHNLPRADRVIFVEYGWNDEINLQCEKRAARKGRDKDLPVRCDYIVSPNSFDERMLSSIFRKMKTVKKVIG